MSVEIGGELAGYRIEGPLGRGGMGFVYLAHHLRLGRNAALKLLSPEVAGDPVSRERFVREWQLLAAIDHPNIIPIYDAGEADGVLFIAMRYVDGFDLKDQIERDSRLAPERAVEVVEQTAAALDAAHARGLVHRDVKPANILIDGASGWIYLTDFGVAKRARTRGLTQEGFFLGTVDYVAPEQIEGKDVGPAADVYALGCVLYESLTGKRPFDKETDIAVIHGHLLDTPPTVTASRPDAPAALDEVVATALAKSEADRYATCGELAAAARAALGGDSVRAPAGATVAARVAARPRPAVSKLPAQPTPLVGRDHELAELDGLLSRTDVRLLTLTGPGGTGKTRLAIEAAAAVEAQRDVCLVTLTGVRDHRLVVAAIATELGVEEGAPDTLLDDLAQRLRDRDLLLVLDNFEQVLPAAADVGRLLAAAPRLQILVTSQSALRLRGENEYAVPPLELPDPSHLDAAAVRDNAAVALFVERARASDPRFELDEENAHAIAEICIRLDGLPLAIELAAARAKLLSPQAMLARLENRLDVLTGGARDLPARHQTLRAALNWSYELLEPDEQALLARLGVFVGSCSLEAAEAVYGGDAFDGLASLLDKSLLRRRETSNGDPRFVLLQTVREYALYRLIERGELATRRRLHADYFVGLAERAEPELHGADQAAWLRRLEEEEDDLRAATTWSLESGEVEVGLRLTGALVRYWSIRGHRAEARGALQSALEQGGDVAPAVRAKALYSAGYAALEQGDYAYAIARFEESHALYGEVDDRRGAALSLAQIGWLALTTGDLERARTASEESVERGRELGDDRITCVALSTLAELRVRSGDVDGAASLLEEALQRRRSLGDRRNIANALLNLGRTELLRDRPEAALPLLEEGLALARELSDGWGTSPDTANPSRSALPSRELTRDESLFAEGLALCRDRGDRRLTAECLYGLAGAAAGDADPVRAARLWAASEAVLDAIGATLSPSEHAIRERYLPQVRDALGEQELSSEWAQGRALTVDRAIAYALEREPRDPSATVASRRPEA